VSPLDTCYEIVELGSPIASDETIQALRSRIKKPEKKPDSLPSAEVSSPGGQALGEEVDGGQSAKVVFGVVDDGIAPLNQRFLRRDKEDKLTTRFESLWYQGTPVSDSSVVGGLVLERKDLDKYLSEQKRAAGKSDFSVYAGINKTLAGKNSKWTALPRGGSHGTHITDCAAGASPWNLPEGLQKSHGSLNAEASAWIREYVDIVGVSLSPESVSDTTGGKLDMQILRAIRWIMHRAIRINGDNGTRPLLINLSLGFSAGAKDGSDTITRSLQREIKVYQKLTGNSARLVLAFGNNHDKRSNAILFSRYEAEADPEKKYSTIGWRIPPRDYTPSYLELRTPDGNSNFEFTLRCPHGGQKTRFGSDIADGVEIFDHHNSKVGKVFKKAPSNGRDGATFVVGNPRFGTSHSAGATG